MKVNSELFEGIFPVRLEGKNADGEEYSYRAFSVREVLGKRRVTVENLYNCWCEKIR